MIMSEQILKLVKEYQGDRTIVLFHVTPYESEANDEILSEKLKSISDIREKLEHRYTKNEYYILESYDEDIYIVFSRKKVMLKLKTSFL